MRCRASADRFLPWRIWNGSSPSKVATNEFKEKFEDEFGKPWIDSRNKFDFWDTIVDVLERWASQANRLPATGAEKAIEPYQISIENFAKMVKEYLDHKGRNHHLVFLVDEIGNYIGDDLN